MIIKDLFSHKIHSSGDEWPLKLIEIASVFAKFDGMPYDRSAIEEEFKKISPRASIVASIVARDVSKYRDEISAYPAYLGLYRVEKHDGKWIFRVTETAKRFLITEEPNVPAFMLLQLALFQYPNGNGASYHSNGNCRLQANAADKTLEFIRNKVHLSPLRLICKALLADSIINGIGPLHPRVTIDEISILCNNPNLNRFASPNISDVISALTEIRRDNPPPVKKFEKRLHILKHTDFIEVKNGHLYLREAYSPEDASRLERLLNLICNIDSQFNDFDEITTRNELSEAVASGSWSRYFDAVTQISSEIVQEISGEKGLGVEITSVQEVDELVENNNAIRFKYPLRERGEYINHISDSSYSVKKQSDPEVTRIKRQKSNLTHKILLSQLDEYLRSFGAKPMDNEHIDLYAEIPNDGSYLFEVKSVCPENLLSQTRKGLSQLYEYRFRYSEDIREDATLCLVYPKEPNEIDWLQDYLCNDRKIAVAWFDGERFCYPPSCSDQLCYLQK